VSSPVIEAGAPAYRYTLDGNSYDTGPHGAHGDPIGAPQTISGILGDALAFDGDDALSPGQLTALEDAPRVTLTTWVRMDADLTTTNTNYVIFDNLHGSTGLRLEIGKR